MSVEQVVQDETVNSTPDVESSGAIASDDVKGRIVSLIRAKTAESLTEANKLLIDTNDPAVSKAAFLAVLGADVEGDGTDTDSCNDSGISCVEESVNVNEDASGVQENDENNANLFETVKEEPLNDDINQADELGTTDDAENGDNDELDDSGFVARKCGYAEVMENDELRYPHSKLLESILSQLDKVPGFRPNLAEPVSRFLESPTHWNVLNLEYLASRQNMEILPEMASKDGNEKINGLDRICGRITAFLEARIPPVDVETELDGQLRSMCGAIEKIFRALIDVCILDESIEALAATDRVIVVLAELFAPCLTKIEPPAFAESRSDETWAQRRNHEKYRELIYDSLRHLAAVEVSEKWQAERQQTMLRAHLGYTLLNHLEKAAEVTTHEPAERCSCEPDGLSIEFLDLLWNTMACRFQSIFTDHMDAVSQLVVKHPTEDGLNGIIRLYPLHFREIPFEEVYDACLAVDPALLIKLLGNAIQFNPKVVAREHALALNELVVREKLESCLVADGMKTLMMISHNNASLLTGCGEGYYDAVIRSNCPTLWQEVGSVLKCVGIQDEEEAARVSNIMIGGCQLISDKVHVNYVLNQLKAVAVVQPDAIRRQQHWIRAQADDKKTKGNAKALLKALTEESRGEVQAVLKKSSSSSMCEVM